MAEVTPSQQFIGTALAIAIVALVLYGIILFIQWLIKRNGNSRTTERETIVQETVVQPTQTYTSIPRPNVSATPSMGGGSAGSGARVSSGGGGKASH